MPLVGMLLPFAEQLIALATSHPNLHTAEGRAPVEGELLEILNGMSGALGGPPITAERLAAADAKTEATHDRFQA